MKKNLLAITGVFFPHNETITHISYKHLCNLDYYIDVISFKGSEDKTVKQHLTNKKNININYVNCDWKKVYIGKKNINVIKIFKSLLQYKRLCLNTIKNKKYDVLYSNSMPNYNHYFAYLVKKRLGDSINWIASFTDPIYENPYVDDLKKSSSIIEKINYFLNKYIYYRKKYQSLPLKYADKLLFISEELRDFVIGNDKQLLKKSMIVPLTYVEEWESYKKLIDSKASFNKNKIKFIHFGNIYGLRKIYAFLDAIKLLKKEGCIDNVEFHQYGDVDKKTLKYINDNNIKNLFIIHDKVSYDKCVDLMKNQSDVLVIFDTIVDDDMVQPFLPSKVLDYLLVSKPIFSITTKHSPVYSMLKDKHICVMYDVDDIIKGIKKQLKNIKIVENDFKKYENKYVIKNTIGKYLDLNIK